jgi:hypothetical protein
MGRHYKNLDTTSLPFSYLIESNDESILVPAINLKSVGTIRDAQKWPVRDRRKDPVKLDFVNFNLLSPYTIQKMADGRNILKLLQKNSGSGSAFFYYNNMKISRHSLERGIELYETGIWKFLGNSIIKRLEGIEFENSGDLTRRLIPDRAEGSGEWTDLAGLIAPRKEVENLLEAIENGEVHTLDMIAQAFGNMFKSYYEWEWRWSAEMIEAETGKKITELTPKDVSDAVLRWKESVIGLDTLLYEDARKEFTLSSMTGFGIDGGEEEKYLDFEQVRGDFESNTYVSAIKEHMEKKRALGDELISRLARIGNAG